MVTVICAVVGFVFTRLRVPAGYALGALAASMVAKFTGNFEGVMPPPVLFVAFVLVGRCSARDSKGSRSRSSARPPSAG